MKIITTDPDCLKCNTDYYNYIVDIVKCICDKCKWNLLFWALIIWTKNAEHSHWTREQLTASLWNPGMIKKCEDLEKCITDYLLWREDQWIHETHFITSYRRISHSVHTTDSHCIISIIPKGECCRHLCQTLTCHWFYCRLNYCTFNYLHEHRIYMIQANFVDVLIFCVCAGKTIDYCICAI